MAFSFVFVDIMISKWQACQTALDVRRKKFQRNADLLKRQLTWQYGIISFEKLNNIAISFLYISMLNVLFLKIIFYIFLNYQFLALGLMVI